MSATDGSQVQDAPSRPLASLSYDARGLSAQAIGPELGLDVATRAAYGARLEDARRAVWQAHERGQLGFLTCIERALDPILPWAQQQRQGPWTDQLVLGIGGSSLGTRAILAAARQEHTRGLRTHFAENIDPVTLTRTLEALPWQTTLLVVITKSGTTVETMGNFWIAYERLIQAVGPEQAARQVVAITDPAKGSLRAMALERGFQTFEVPPEVGGRFSVLTAVGLVPLALAGYPVEELIQGALQARQRAMSDEVADNACLQATLDQLALLERGVSQCVMMTYCDALLPLVDWFRQLWAESLGKLTRHDQRPTGITPISAVGTIDQHSQVQLYMEGPKDKHVTFLRVLRPWHDLVIPQLPGLPESLSHLYGKPLSQIMEASLQGTRAALEAQGRPTSVWTFDEVSPANLGAFILVWELMTAVAGHLLQVDPFDQPGVELGKKIAHGLLGRAEHVALAQQTVAASRQDGLEPSSDPLILRP